MSRRTLVVLAAALAGLPTAVAAVEYRPPVDDPVARTFEAPLHRWSPGNRGLEYKTEPGTPVHSTADGTVVFAGPVAGRLFVTVRHSDGVSTTYSYLESIGVRVGQDVSGGQVVGRAGPAFQLGAKRDGRYIDPASLFADRRARLVPMDAPALH